MAKIFKISGYLVDQICGGVVDVETKSKSQRI